MPPLSAIAARKARLEAAAKQAAQAASPSTATRRASSRLGGNASDRLEPKSDSAREPAPTAPVRRSMRQASPEVVIVLSSPEPDNGKASPANRASGKTTTPRRSRRFSSSAADQPTIAPRSRRASATSTPSIATVAQTRYRRASASTPTKPNVAKSETSNHATPASASSKKRSSHNAEEDDFELEIQNIIDELKAGHDNDESHQRQPPKKRARASRKTTSETPTKTLKKDKESPAKITPSRAPRASKGGEKETGKRSASRQSWISTPDTTKLRAAARYYLDDQDAQEGSPKNKGRAKAKTKAKTTTDPYSSAMPIEDQETGFLAFGQEEEDEEEEEEEEESEDEIIISSFSKSYANGKTREEDEVGSSDEEMEDTSTDFVPATPELNSPRKSKRTRSAALVVASSSVNASGDELSTPIATTSRPSPEPADTASGPTIPYSNFALSGEDSAYPNHIIHSSQSSGKFADYYVFGLRENESLAFIGTGSIKILKGSARIGGALLSATTGKVGSASVFAPASQPLPIIKAVTGHDDGPANFSIEEEQILSTQAFPHEQFCTIVKISPLASSVDDICKVFPASGLNTLFGAPPKLPLFKFTPLSSLQMLFEPDVASLTAQQKYNLNNNISTNVGLSAVYTPHAWQTALNNLSTAVLSAAREPQEDSVIALIRGNKKVGKSTFSRMALERVLTMGREVGDKVAFLELDLGQSDFGPPGMVALHVFDVSSQSGMQAADKVPITLGPGWCQPRLPIRAHFIGDVSPKDDPESYIGAILDLVRYFKSEIQPGNGIQSAPVNGLNGDAAPKRVPLVVNTQGWMKGLGADLASRIEILLCPTHIFDIVPRGSLQTQPSVRRGPQWLDSEGAILASGPEITTLASVNQVGFISGAFNPSVPQNAQVSAEMTGSGDGGPVPPPYVTAASQRLTAQDIRTLNLISYFHANNLSPEGRLVAWDFTKPLVHWQPLVVDVEEGLKAGIQVLSLGASVPDSHKLGALNSSIVGIVATASDEYRADFDKMNHDCNGIDTNPNSPEQDAISIKWKNAFRRGQSLEGNPRAHCLGLAIVRSIDVPKAQLHLLTPVPLSELAKCSALGIVKGGLELPVWASLDFETVRDAKEGNLDVELSAPTQKMLAGMPRPQVPYLEWPMPLEPASHLRQGQSSAYHSSVGSQKRKIRRNLMRKSQHA